MNNINYFITLLVTISYFLLVTYQGTKYIKTDVVKPDEDNQSITTPGCTNPCTSDCDGVSITGGF